MGFPDVGPWMGRVLGWGYLILLLTLALVTAPLYLYRVLVKVLAKWGRSGDLCEVGRGESAGLMGDYFPRRDKQGISRSNVVVVLTFQGHLTMETVKGRVYKNWIGGQEKGVAGERVYEKLQQYPVRWWGYTFWKKGAATFKGDKHLHLLAGEDTPMSEEKLDEAVENLGNEPFPQGQSPWGLYLVENYEAREPVYTGDSKEDARQSVLIFKVHHCLTDGVGMARALVEGLFETPLEDIIRREKIPPVSPPSPWRTFWYRITFPGRAMWEMSQILAHVFLDTPWKVTDANKKGRQIYIKSGPVPLQLIKDIRNWFGVTFTEVLSSAISAAAYQTLLNQGHQKPLKSLLLCLRNTTPLENRRHHDVFENHTSTSILPLPIGDFPSAGDRLQAVHRKVVQNRGSVVPLLASHWTSFTGAQLFPLCRALSPRKGISISLSNFKGLPVNLSMDLGKSVWTQTEGVVGPLPGDTGVSLTVLSHGSEIRLQAALEEALMTRAEAQQFMTYILDEIGLLWELMLENPVVTR